MIYQSWDNIYSISDLRSTFLKDASFCRKITFWHFGGFYEGLVLTYLRSTKASVLQNGGFGVILMIYLWRLRSTIFPFFCFFAPFGGPCFFFVSLSCFLFVLFLSSLFFFLVFSTCFGLTQLCNSNKRKQGRRKQKKEDETTRKGKKYPPPKKKRENKKNGQKMEDKRMFCFFSLFLGFVFVSCLPVLLANLSPQMPLTLGKTRFCLFSCHSFHFVLAGVVVLALASLAQRCKRRGGWRAWKGRPGWPGDPAGPFSGPFDIAY